MNLNQLLDYLKSEYNIVFKRGTIYKYTSQKIMPFKKPFKDLIFDKKDIDKWIKTKLK